MLDNCHHYINSVMKRLGYNVDDDGVCNGIAHMALPAFLLDEIKPFNKRLKSIYFNWKKIKSLKKRLGNIKLLTNPSYIKIIKKLQDTDYLAFFDGIVLHQNPDDYPEIFGKILSQFKPLKVAKVIESLKLAKRGGLYQVDHYFNYYTKHKLEKFLYRIKKHAHHNKIALSFSCDGHKTLLGYDGRKDKWMFINANKLPIHKISSHKLSKTIFSSHTFDKKFNKAPFSIRLYGLRDALTQINRFNTRLNHDSRFLALQTIKQKNAFKKINDSTLFHLAADYGCNKTIKQILNLDKIDINIKNDDKETPLHCAVDNGHFEIAKELLESVSININATNDSNETALYIACKNGERKLVDLLLRHRANPEIINDDNYSAMTISVMKGYGDILIIFLRHNINIFKPDGNNKSVIDYASENNNQEILKFLIYEKNRIELNQQTFTPLRKHNLFSTSLSQELIPEMSLQPNRKKIKLS